MRYYLSDNGGWLTVSGDDVFGSVPDGYREVTEAEFNAAAGTITVALPQEQPGRDEPGAGKAPVEVPAIGDQPAA
ncbi:hypothetical protein ACIOHC_10990 [Streptomyces sp. NPDC088252]|uniref:hypothetical protein n=1 Tax=unclassified Streptomyces TaxID=2593676 RepID=UPI0037F76A92